MLGAPPPVWKAESLSPSSPGKETFVPRAQGNLWKTMEVVETTSHSHLGSGQLQISPSFPGPGPQLAGRLKSRPKAHFLLSGPPTVFLLLDLTFFGIHMRWSGWQCWRQGQVMCLLGTELGVTMLGVQASATGPTPRGFPKSKVPQANSKAGLHCSVPPKIAALPYFSGEYTVINVLIYRWLCFSTHLAF